ncbi:allatostatin-A receptor-like [Lineus longissimus]|uniref:allatostatin-A receptor-like n=1 Tax=Lineus longissimus TaxID=88925 RepID=UPI00315CE7BF
MVENNTDAFVGSSEEETSNQSPLYQVMGILSIVVCCIIVLTGVLGNLLVIIAVFINKQMGNTPNILIASLAVADLSFIVLCVPFATYAALRAKWPVGQASCKVLSYATFATSCISIFTLILMSLDRYLAIVHPASRNIRTKRNAYIGIATTWVAGLSANIPVYFTFRVEEYAVNEEQRSRCSPTSWPNALFTTFFVTGYIIPLSIIIILNGLTVKHMLCDVNIIVSQSEESMRCRRRASKMVVVVVAVFAICWLPNHIRLMYISYRADPKTTEFYILATISQILCYSNSCVNPIIYSFMSENFRKEFRKHLCCEHTGV